MTFPYFGDLMPRTARACLGGYTYHVLNRGNARATIFHKPADYDAFIEIMAEASLRHPMRILAYCLMPNHFHLALWPHADGDLSRWMHWLLTTHVGRYLRHYHSSGHIWQGRFKAFPTEEDEHLLTVLRVHRAQPVAPAWSTGLRRGRGRACAGWPSPISAGPAGTGDGPARHGVGRGSQRRDDRSRGGAGARMCATRPAVRVGGLDDGHRLEPRAGVESSAARASPCVGGDAAERGRLPWRVARKRMSDA